MSEKLALIWIAQFNDGTLLHQFDNDEQTIEHKFQEVLDRQADLKIFHLVNIKTNHIYQLDLTLGRFHFLTPGFINNPEDKVEGEPGNKYRLIFFRRWQHDIGWQPATNHVVSETRKGKYFLGFQYTTADNKNIQRIAQITENDEVYLV